MQRMSAWPTWAASTGIMASASAPSLTQFLSLWQANVKRRSRARGPLPRPPCDMPAACGALPGDGTRGPWPSACPRAGTRTAHDPRIGDAAKRPCRGVCEAYGSWRDAVGRAGPCRSWRGGSPGCPPPGRRRPWPASMPPRIGGRRNRAARAASRPARAGWPDRRPRRPRLRGTAMRARRPRGCAARGRRGRHGPASRVRRRRRSLRASCGRRAHAPVRPGTAWSSPTPRGASRSRPRRAPSATRPRGSRARRARRRSSP